MMLASSIIWQSFAKEMFLSSAVVRGVETPPLDYAIRTEVFLKASTAIIILFYLTLWAIKLSFLFFFRRIYLNIASWMRYWWVIFTVTISCYFVCIGCINYNCLLKPLKEIAIQCSSDSTARSQRAILILNFVLDSFTDVLSKLSILRDLAALQRLSNNKPGTCSPFAVLRKVRISTRRRLALGGVFCVTIVTIVFAIVRIVLITSKSWQLDMTWLYIWSNIECYAGTINTLHNS
jgi:hypothetical protein